MTENFEGWRVTLNCGTKYSFGHNLRDPKYVESQVHIDPKGKHEMLLHLGNEREAYQKIFGEAIKKYNAKQKRKDRRITDYYQKIIDDERKGTHKNPKANAERKPFYEFQFYIGNRDSHCPDNIAKKVLSLYIQKVMPKKFPNFIPTSIAIHNDEFSYDRKGNRIDSPLHFHVVGIYVAHALSEEELKEEYEYREKCKETKMKELSAKGIKWDEKKWKNKDWRREMIERWGKSLEKGMELQSSMNAACNEMGFFTEKGKGTAQQQFEESVRHDLMDFAESLGIKINRTKGYKHSHKEKDIYVAEQNNNERSKELDEKQKVLEAKELAFQNEKDDFDYKIENLEEREQWIKDKEIDIYAEKENLRKESEKIENDKKIIKEKEQNVFDYAKSVNKKEIDVNKKFEDAKKLLEKSEQDKKETENSKNEISKERQQIEFLLNQNQQTIDKFNSENREKIQEIKNWKEATQEIKNTDNWLEPIFDEYKTNLHKENALQSFFTKIKNGIKAVIAKVKQSYDKKLEELNKQLFGYKKIYTSEDKSICEYNYGANDYTEMLVYTPVSEIEKAIAETRKKGKTTFAEAAETEKHPLQFYERYFTKAKTLLRERTIEIEKTRKHYRTR